MTKPLRFMRQYGWLILLSSLLVIALFVMSQILQNASQFAQSYIPLLAITFSGAALLIAFLIRTLFKLSRQYQAQVAGTKLASHLTLTMTFIIGLPLAITYYFSMTFIHQGIDQWFDTKTETALQQALALVETTLNEQTQQKLQQTQTAVEQDISALLTDPVIHLNQLRQTLYASELTLYNSNGQVRAFSSSGNSLQLPPFNPLQLQQLHEQAPVAILQQNNQQMAILVYLPLLDFNQTQKLTLQAKFNLHPQITQLTETVRTAAGQYQENAFLKAPLKTSFQVILSLVFLLAFITALLFTLQTVRNLVRPIETLAQGTRAVAQGDYSLTMPVEKNDDFGLLIHSFNDMTQQIARARNEIKYGHEQTKIQKIYSQAIIENLTSGVVTLDINLRLKTINQATNQILNVELFNQLGKPLQEVLNQPQMAHIQPLFEQILPLFQNKTESWQQQINFHAPQGKKILMIHGSTLPSLDQKISGFIMVIEDITELIKAQIHAAWSDVAKRLAHEIKNPLTPIQLSAERLQYKLASKLEAADQALLNRLTHTIIEQVDSMQQMVTAFSEYADTPKTELRAIDLNQLVLDVSSMYSSPNQSWTITHHLDPNLPLIQADPTLIRQLLHNLIKNALEAATPETTPTQLSIYTQQIEPNTQLTVCDNGPGIPQADQNWIFEPYATDKPKGTGLGLAIVKKIVDEHQGQISLLSTPGEATCFKIILPN